MNRSFKIDVHGFSEKAEAALERMVADFVAGLPARLKMDRAMVAMPANTVTKKPKPKPAAPAKPAAKGKAGGKTRK